MKEFAVKPDPEDPRLVRRVVGVDHDGKPVETSVVMERPLTLFLNGQEIVTMMTIGDHPRYLAVGYLLNQNMLRPDDTIEGIDYDEELETVVVRTGRRTNFEKKLRKKTLTSGCAQGTVFGDLMEKFEEIALPADAVLKTSWLYALTKKINTAPSLYLAAGAIHGCVLCEEDRPLVYMEDVGRHNAVDKIAGYMHLEGVSPAGKIFYTTGRLTSEMVIKTVQMRIPILVSRSGFTAWGVDLARRAGLTLVGRAKGKRFVALAGEGRIVYDGDASGVEEERPRARRKASLEEEDAL
ncbi:MAG TPA: formate dehydrogenase accessory sulfurtransferase FdhD [Stellaceae bacterium]|nr:formate dehydrogenase accessory sulfurtransferase FdhD [Stellaceae bacterium]